MASKVGTNDMKNDWMTDTITQVSILDALLASRFDGCLLCGELLKYGDHGIGTFDRMDGEMIVVDGCMYQVKADGKVYTPDPDNRTPFATVCRFRPKQTWTLSEPIDMDAMEKMIDEKASKPKRVLRHSRRRLFFVHEDARPAGTKQAVSADGGSGESLPAI